jgi:acetyltransferase-like isoleucine patch superfamily enzyme
MMKLLKLWYHTKAGVKKRMYCFLSGNKISFGKNTTFRNDFNAMIEGEGHIKIGSNCFFNNGCSVNSMQEVVIGDGTIFGENSYVYDHNHRFRSTENSIKSQGYAIAPVHIGKHVWIGSNVVILKGVNIGDNAVIGAGCVIEQDVPEGAIVKSGSGVSVTMQGE